MTGSHVGTNSSGSTVIGIPTARISLTGVASGYSCRAIMLPAAVFNLDLSDGTSTGSTTFAQGTAQVETATISTTGAVTNGTLTMVLTAAGLVGSPLTINVPITSTAHSTAALVTAAARTALSDNAAVAAMFTIGGTGANIVLTNKGNVYTVGGGTQATFPANDATLNLATDGTFDAITAAATSVSTTAGVASTGTLIYDVGYDFEGVAIPTSATRQGVLYAVSTGAGVITGGTSEVINYAGGSYIQLANATALPQDETIAITATTETDITITVAGTV